MPADHLADDTKDHRQKDLLAAAAGKFPQSEVSDSIMGKVRRRADQCTAAPD
jgi:hypothetical protein